MAQESNPFTAVLEEIFGRSVEPDREDSAPTREPLPSGFSNSAAALLDSLGLGDPDERDGVVAQVTASLDELGLDAAVASFRYGMLTIDTDPATARLLRLQTQRLLAALTETHPGEVTGLVVRVRRRPRRTGAVPRGADTA